MIQSILIISLLIGGAAPLTDIVAHSFGTPDLWLGISFHFAGRVAHIRIHLIEIVSRFGTADCFLIPVPLLWVVITAQLIVVFIHSLECQLIRLKQVFS